MELMLKRCCLWALLALILMVVIPCRMQENADTEGMNATACTSELKNCLITNNQQEKCTKMKNRLSCYGETGDDGCRVDESVVLFDDILPTFTDICNGVQELPACWDLTHCLIDTEYSRVDNAINHTTGPNLTQSLLLTSTHFWCRYLSQSVQCVNDNAEKCSMNASDRQVLQSRAYWLAPTCDGQDTASVSSVCRNYVSNCLKATPVINGTRSCQGQLNELKCINNSRNHGCDVRELMNVTFDGLASIHANVCEVVNPVLGVCGDLRECMEGQYYAQIPALHSARGPPPAIYPRLLASPFWCQHLNQTINCFLRKASTCNVSLDDVNHFRDTVGDYVSELCAGDMGNAGGLNYNGAVVPSPSFFLFTLALFCCLLSVTSNVLQYRL